MTVPPSLGEFFTFLGTAGCIGFMLSFIAENWTYFQTRNKQGKIAILILVSIVLGLLSHTLVTYMPAGIVAATEPYYKVIVSSIAIVLASQVWHKAVNKQESTMAVGVGYRPLYPSAALDSTAFKEYLASLQQRTLPPDEAAKGQA